MRMKRTILGAMTVPLALGTKKLGEVEPSEQSVARWILAGSWRSTPSPTNSSSDASPTGSRRSSPSPQQPSPTQAEGEAGESTLGASFSMTMACMCGDR